MNKKGFASSTIVFSLLSVFLIALSILLITVTNTSKVKNTLNEKVVSNIEYGSSSLNDIEQRLTELEKSTLKLDDIYPVGSIYISTTDDTIEKVQERFGGEWENYAQGTSLVSAGTYTDSNGNVTTYKANESGGSNMITLNASNLPAHTHTVKAEGTVSSTFEGDTGTTDTDGKHQHAGIHYEDSYGLGSSSTEPYGTDPGKTATMIGTTGWNTSKLIVLSDRSAHSHQYTPSGNVSSTFTGTSVETSSTGSNTSFNVQNPYTSVYMYKRIK